MYTATKDERTWAMLSHLAALAGYVVPLGNIFGPLVVWLLKKDQSSFVDDQGKEALNFQISLTIYFIISGILILLLIGIPLLAVLPIFGLIMIIIAAVKANEGVPYRYPLTMRLIK